MTPEYHVSFSFTSLDKHEKRLSITILFLSNLYILHSQICTSNNASYVIKDFLYRFSLLTIIIYTNPASTSKTSCEHTFG